MSKNCYKIAKNFDDVIVILIFHVIKMRQLKRYKVSRALAEYLDNGSTDFHQTYTVFIQSYVEVFEIIRLNQ